MASEMPHIIESLQPYISDVLGALNAVPEKRQAILRQGTQFIKGRLEAGCSAKLNFICTHNSRRSHLAHVWAQTAASYYGLSEDGLNTVQTFSGGTEATACNPRTVAALVRAGFAVDCVSLDVQNPKYRVTYDRNHEAIVCFSKVYDQSGNPDADYAAMMCCSDVDERCPIVNGAIARIPLHYDDPKSADDSPDEVIRYDERCRQIAVEMFWMLGRVL